ncbi:MULTISPECIES: cytochrome P450 [unclassified Brevundimonas]|uniref:cytochrome P450 n=1 Tax=unclassified Brevundimonas TaxID=2622653 RepID=UPI0025C213D7|nr:MULTISPECIES: cytochrome P450 [unclassified Brevundimonas]
MGRDLEDAVTSGSDSIPKANPDGWLSSLKMTRDYLSDPLGTMRSIHEHHGGVAQMNLFGMKAVVLLGPLANELVLLNRDNAFSSEIGWTPVIGSTFPNGLISLDGNHHREDRRMIGAAFKPEPMQVYLKAMGERFSNEIRAWPEQLTFYPAIKQLTLASAARDLLGLSLGAEVDAVSRAFVSMLGASAALVRHPLPGNALWRGIKARGRLKRFLLDEIPRRRVNPGRDIFSTVCNATDDEGRAMADEAIVDHMNLLLMAAHDTTTSALTSIVYLLGRHPEWQAYVRDELLAWRDQGDLYAGLRDLKVTEMVLHEALRLYPPVASLPRGLVKDVEFGGCTLPTGSAVGIHILHTHYMPELWPEPTRFDPLRFSPEHVRTRHKYAWIPFGGGAHMCLGLHFASMQVKLFLSDLLRERTIVVSADYEMDMQWIPISKPRDGLPISLALR